MHGKLTQCDNCWASDNNILWKSDALGERVNDYFSYNYQQKPTNKNQALFADLFIYYRETFKLDREIYGKSFTLVQIILVFCFN
jgi:hypothetical protein